MGEERTKLMAGGQQVPPSRQTKNVAHGRAGKFTVFHTSLVNPRRRTRTFPYTMVGMTEGCGSS
jgi:hypothetical protein